MYEFYIIHVYFYIKRSSLLLPPHIHITHNSAQPAHPVLRDISADLVLINVRNQDGGLLTAK